MWNNVYTFVWMKKKEPRKVRGYKIADNPYKKAMKRAKKENMPLATLIEDVVVGYGEGDGRIFIYSKTQKLK